MKRRRFFIYFFVSLMTSIYFMASWANTTEDPLLSQEMYPFSSAHQMSQFQTLSKEIRCLVCQNQNIADSNAPLAKDLRAKIFAMLQRGESPEEIKTYLEQRYGEFILLKPRFNVVTLGIWMWPIVLAGILFFVLRRVVKG